MPQEATTCAIAAMCSGVVPQHPPMTFTSPLSMNGRTLSAITDGLWSYLPSSSGIPAFGCALTKQGAFAEISSIRGSIRSAPKEQFRPTDITPKGRTDARNASTVCPERSLPEMSVTEAETITGTFLPAASQAFRAAERAAFALRVSKTVSIRSKSTLPSTRDVICSR